MALDMNKVKERLQKLQSKGSGDRIDYKKLFFKPQLGKQTVRIVPNKFNKDFPFAEVTFHNQNVFKKNIYSLENWGEKDPVVQLRKELYNDDDPETKETSQDTAKKLSTRSKAFAQVIVRGRESEGVLLWEMNKTTYENVLNILSQDEEYGDITDIMEGTDLVVEGYTDVVKIGKRSVEYVAVNITPKRKTSALSEDEKMIEKWLSEQKNPLEIYKRYTYDEIKNLLREWMDPENASDDEDTVPKKSSDDDEDDAPAPKAKLEKSPKAKVVDEDDSDDEDEAPAPKAKVKVKAKPVEDDEDEDDELPQTKTATKEIVKGSTSVKSSKQKFAEMFDDEDDE